MRRFVKRASSTFPKRGSGSIVRRSARLRLAIFMITFHSGHVLFLVETRFPSHSYPGSVVSFPPKTPTSFEPDAHRGRTTLYVGVVGSYKDPLINPAVVPHRTCYAHGGGRQHRKCRAPLALRDNEPQGGPLHARLLLGRLSVLEDYVLHRQCMQ